MIKQSYNLKPPDFISRSLLQKAVRRSNVKMLLETIQVLLNNNESEWLNKRLFVITFEECWSFSENLNLRPTIDNTIELYKKLTTAVKNKDAAGLGELAVALLEGDTSVLLNSEEDLDIKIVAAGVNRPFDFWKWMYSNKKLSKIQIKAIKSAEKGYSLAKFKWDKTFAIATAYLIMKFPEIETVYANEATEEFPLWVCIDKHTSIGKQVIAKSATSLGISSIKAYTLSFYFESAFCVNKIPSLWWDRAMEHKLKTLNLDVSSGKILWDKLKPLIIYNLSEELKQLSDRYKDYQGIL